VADRNGARALVLLDDAGHILAGMGPPPDVAGLARTARNVVWRRASRAEIEALPCDVSARSIATRDGMLYFGAMGDGVSGLGEAARAIQRILAA
jgi:hypothetical protein